MLALVLKKSARDVWQHLGVIIAGNLGALVIAFVLGVLVLDAARLGLSAGILGLALAMVASVWLAGIAAYLVAQLLGGHAVAPGALRRFAWRTLLPAIMIALAQLGLLAAFGLVLLALADAGTMPWVIGLGIACWLAVVWAEIVLFLPAAGVIARGQGWDAVRTAFLLAFDNPGFALAVLLVILLMIPLAPTLLTGPLTMLVVLDNAARLRLRKYQWHADHPDQPLDWSAALAPERRHVGQLSARAILARWRA